MRILTALTYYRPHYSGLTIYAERLARALAARGHTVTVLTSQYDRALPTREVEDGVQIERLPVLLRISKGVIMPGMLRRAWQLARQADVVLLHLPQLDAAPVALISRLLGKPVIVTYHCDLTLPSGMIHRLANLASNLANSLTARLAKVIVHNSQDYAVHSPFLKKHLAKVRAVPPPIEIAPASPADLASFEQKAGIQPGQRLIGIAARLAAEKGVEYLAQALPLVLQKHPTARVLMVGPYQNIVGEEAYARRLAPLIASLDAHWSFLGVLKDGEFSAFLQSCEVTVLPSINPTESYGMVQVEAMACGTPVIATDRPGVRVPVQLTDMGKLVPQGDAPALAEAIVEVLDHPAEYQGSPQALLAASTPEAVAKEYEQFFSGNHIPSDHSPARRAAPLHPSLEGKPASAPLSLRERSRDEEEN
jgi:glycosyltransferase involved in cell wall biosynthesis